MSEEPYNISMLNELTEVMGKDAVLANMDLFADLMPTYLDNLQRYLSDWQATSDPQSRKLVAEEAHKIKGALSSIGLEQLQRVAQQAQSDNGKQWEENISSWAERIQSIWQLDLQAAREYINMLDKV